MINDLRVRLFVQQVLTQVSQKQSIFCSSLPSVYELAVATAGKTEIFYTRFFHHDEWFGKSRDQIAAGCIEQAADFFHEFNLPNWRILCGIYVELIQSGDLPEWFFKVVYSDRSNRSAFYYCDARGTARLTGESLTRILEHRYNDR